MLIIETTGTSSVLSRHTSVLLFSDDGENGIRVLKFLQTTRVGGGPFPSEQDGDVGRMLQDIGGEIVGS